VHRLNMHCIKVAKKNVWGPFSIEDEITDPRLLTGHYQFIYDDFNGVIPVIRFDCPPGIWVWSTCTRECRHAFFG